MKKGKDRLDKFYFLAKEQGYRARSAFKLIQLNKKYNFLNKARVVIDLCAAPGSWCQVAKNVMPMGTSSTLPSSSSSSSSSSLDGGGRTSGSNIIIGIDLAPIKPIPGVISLQEDITTGKCRQSIKKHIHDWKADVVLHDGAPNVGSNWAQDAYAQNELTLSAMKLAVEFLKKGGTFVTKVFRSKDYTALIWVMKQLFETVEATKPKSSRNVSAEIFVVAQGFKAPDKLDPRFLDPKHIFKDVADVDPATGEVGLSKTLAENSIFGKKKRKAPALGYDDNDLLLFKKCPVIHFLTGRSGKRDDNNDEDHNDNDDDDDEDKQDGDDHGEDVDPIVVLATHNQLTWSENGEDDIYFNHPDTTEEVKTCMKDLKLLGKGDFKLLLKWRLKMREFDRARRAEGKKTEEQDQEKDEVKVTIDTDEMEEKELEEALRHLSAAERSKMKSKLRKQRKERQKKQHRIDMGMELHQKDPERIIDPLLFNLKT